MQKNSHITIEHVQAHLGISTPEHLGNQMADDVAKNFLKIGETCGATKYFTFAEEPIILWQSNRYILGDIRPFLKSVELTQMTNIWKVKAPRQAEIFLKHPIQVRKQ